MEIDNCYFCQTAFNSIDHQPFILPCGHSICKKYIDKAYSKEKGEIKCPLDNQPLRIENIENIKKNF